MDSSIDDSSSTAVVLAPEMTRFQQFSIRLFAILLIFYGVGSLVLMAYRLSHDHLFIDFSFIGIFIGKGLLDGKELWRKWAIAAALLGMVSSFLIVPILLFSNTSPTLFIAGSHIESGKGILYAIAPIGFFFGLWQLLILAKSTAKESFTREGSPTGWWLPIAVCSLAIFSILFIVNAKAEQLFRSIHCREVTVKVYDANTKKVIFPTWGTSGKNTDDVFPKYSSGYSTGDNQLSISWIGIKPFPVTISAEGYREEVLFVDQDTPEHVDIFLKKRSEADEPPSREN